MVVRRSSNKNVLFQFNQYKHPVPIYLQVISQRKLGVPWLFSLRMSIYGGETIKESAKRLETAPIDIICATPGRLIALLDETKLPGCIGYAAMAMMARKMAIAVDASNVLTPQWVEVWPLGH